MFTLHKTLLEAWSLKKNLRTLFIRENQRWAFLDGYRAIGIFWVILGHCVMLPQQYFGMEQWAKMIMEVPVYFHWVANGDVAVDGFLMVSAFLMGNILMKQHQQTGKLPVKLFYFSRLMRLTPLYFLTLIGYSMVAPDHKLIWPNFFYIQNFFDDFERYALPYTWSLAVEEQFYLLLPFYLIFILLRTAHPFYHLAALTVLSLLIRALVILTDPILSTETIQGIIFNRENFGHAFVVVYDNLYTRFGAFIPGLLVAYVYRYRNEACQQFLQTSYAFWITVFAMALALALFTLPVLKADFELPHWLVIVLNISRSTLVCFCAGWMLFCGLFESKNAARFNRVMSSKLFHPFGHLLYSMYLFHYVAVGFVLKNMNYNFRLFGIDYMANYEAWFALAVLLSILLASIIAIFTYLFIEAPIMNLRPKYRD